MLIQITTITGELVKTITVEEIESPRVMVYCPCLYCNVKLVRVPAKFCCTAHRVYYKRKDIGSAIS